MDTFTARLRITASPQCSRYNAAVQCVLSVPFEAAAAAGIADGDRCLVSREDDRLVLAKTERKGRVAKWVRREFINGGGDVRLKFGGLSLGLPSVHGAAAIEVQAIDDGRLAFVIPDGFEKQAGRPHPSQMPPLHEAARGLHGAAYALVQDNLRRPEFGARRAVGIEQAVALLREAGCRVERTGAGLWRIDGLTRSTADLAEAARRIDAEAVLVAA